MQTTESECAPVELSLAPASVHVRALLSEEHRRFSRLLDVLADELALFHRGEQPDYELLQDAFFYLTNYPDRFHHPKEDLLFAAIAERAPQVQAYVQELGHQHHRIADAGTRFLAKLQTVLNDGVLTRAEVEQPALEYIALYRAHIALEEREIFALGEKCLRPEDWAMIDAQNHSERDPLFGAVLDPRYLSLRNQVTQADASG
jgi:hemerythrin-like domain-containing protein